jgi:hypothetical protein
MSTCAHGISPAKRARNAAAVIGCARRSGVALTMSAYWPRIASSYIGSSGSRQTRSPVLAPAAATVWHHASSLLITPANAAPRAVTIPPVSVAMSTSRSAPSPIAWVMQSASTRRPSASVLLISIVVPSEAVTMSPGRMAWPEGMFSVAPTTPMTRTGRLSRAIAPTASMTAAPPDMSNFISAILAAGLIEMPPVSNVTALPIRPSTDPLASAPSYRRTMSAGSLWAPWATAPNAPIPCSARKSRPKTSTSTPASARARSARAAGVMSLAGVFCRSRAAFWASATTAAASTGADTSWWALTASDSRPLDPAWSESESEASEPLFL